MRVILGGPLAVELEVGSMVPTPFELQNWHREVVGADAAAKHQSEHTRSGWPIAIYPGDSRVVAFFSFFEYSAIVSFAGPLSDQLLDTLQTAEPDWRDGGQITCLAELVS